MYKELGDNSAVPGLGKWAGANTYFHSIRGNTLSNLTKDSIKLFTAFRGRRQTLCQPQLADVGRRQNW
jgi:hypothetical protein